MMRKVQASFFSNAPNSYGSFPGLIPYYWLRSWLVGWGGGETFIFVPCFDDQSFCALGRVRSSFTCWISACHTAVKGTTYLLENNSWQAEQEAVLTFTQLWWQWGKKAQNSQSDPTQVYSEVSPIGFNRTYSQINGPRDCSFRKLQNSQSHPRILQHTVRTVEGNANLVFQ